MASTDRHAPSEAAPTSAAFRTVATALLSRVGGLLPAKQSPAHAVVAADALAIETDANGSPVTVPAAEWLVCFVPGLKRQWWHRFASARHKHVFALRNVDEERWLLVEPWWTRLMVSILTPDEAIKFLRWGADGDILRVREAIPGQGCQARGWANCAVLVSFMLGRSYWTWTPHGLYRRLEAEVGTERVELPQFLSEHLRFTASRKPSQAAAIDCRVRHGVAA